MNALPALLRPSSSRVIAGARFLALGLLWSIVGGLAGIRITGNAS